MRYTALFRLYVRGRSPPNVISYDFVFNCVNCLAKMNESNIFIRVSKYIIFTSKYIIHCYHHHIAGSPRSILAISYTAKNNSCYCRYMEC